MTIASIAIRRATFADAAATSQLVHWILRVSLMMCFVGHGAFGVRRKVDWLVFFHAFGISDETAFQLMPLIGTMDITLGILGLLLPMRFFVGYMAFWGIFTALLRPLVGMSFFETLERAGNYGPMFAMLVGTVGMGAFAVVSPLDLSNQLHFEKVKRILVATIALLLLGHGMLALGGKPMLIQHWASIGVVGVNETGAVFTRVVGGLEVAAAVLVYFRPTLWLCAVIFIWKVFTESLFLTAGDPFWEWVERGGSYCAPLALFVVLAHGSSKRFDADLTSSAEVAAPA